MTWKRRFLSLVSAAISGVIPAKSRVINVSVSDKRHIASQYNIDLKFSKKKYKKKKVLTVTSVIVSYN